MELWTDSQNDNTQLTGKFILVISQIIFTKIKVFLMKVIIFQLITHTSYASFQRFLVKKKKTIAFVSFTKKHKAHESQGCEHKESIWARTLIARIESPQIHILAPPYNNAKNFLGGKIAGLFSSVNFQKLFTLLMAKARVVLQIYTCLHLGQHQSTSL